MRKDFWSYVEKGEGCWLWQGPKHRHGYGMWAVTIKPPRRSAYAHRVAYSLVKGPIPPGMVVMHTCDVRACVNPAHLEVGTQGDNIRDASAKGLLAGKQQPRTHCVHGHPLTSENTVNRTTRGKTYRRCLTCQRHNGRETYRRRSTGEPPPPNWYGKRTHCANGHEWTPENTRARTDGTGRRCRKCELAQTYRTFERLAHLRQR